jgi:hypothetical protein
MRAEINRGVQTHPAGFLKYRDPEEPNGVNRNEVEIAEGKQPARSAARRDAAEDAGNRELGTR